MTQYMYMYIVASLGLAYDSIRPCRVTCRTYILLFSHRTCLDVSSIRNLLNVFFCNYSINGEEAQMQENVREHTTLLKQQNEEN